MAAGNARTFKVAWLALGAALLFPLTVFGDDELVGPPPQFIGPPAPPTIVEEVVKVIDEKRDYVSHELVDVVRDLDRFFGTDRHYQETNDSVFQLDTTRVMGYGGEHRFVVSARANVHLPNAEKKYHLVLETNPDRNAVVNPKQTQTAPLVQPVTPQSYGAALRFLREEAKRWHFNADGGLKFQGLSVTPFVRSRASLAVPVDDDRWRANLAETVFWFNTIGVGETTQLDLDRTISEPLLFRATSTATWLHDRQNFDLRQDFIVFHTLDERRAFLYQASVIGVSHPVALVTDYVVQIQYRYRLHKKWMYFDVNPQLHFPQERAYSLSPMLSLRLEMMFDESKQGQ